MANEPKKPKARSLLAVLLPRVHKDPKGDCAKRVGGPKTRRDSARNFDPRIGATNAERRTGVCWQKACVGRKIDGQNPLVNGGKMFV